MTNVPPSRYTLVSFDHVLDRGNHLDVNSGASAGTEVYKCPVRILGHYQTFNEALSAQHEAATKRTMPKAAPETTQNLKSTMVSPNAVEITLCELERGWVRNIKRRELLETLFIVSPGDK